MNGKTFLRTVGFAQSYGHGWAHALLSEAACEDPITGAFSKAANIALFDPDEEKRVAAEGELGCLAASQGQQEKLIEAADRFLSEQEGDIPGIRATSCFSAKKDGLHYDHITGSGRLEVWVHEGVAEFSISRPGEQDLFCLAVSLTNGETGVFSRDLDPVRRRVFRVYSGDPEELFSEDHDACVRRWEKYLRLRHVWALEEAVRAFFSLVADHELRADVLAAVHAEAAAVFRKQPLTAEVSFWDWKEEERCTAVLREGDSYLRRGNASVPLPPATRSLLLQELERVHTLSPNAPTLMPFDYSPSSPEVSFFRDFFKLPTEGVPYSGMRGVFAVLGTACHGLPAGNGEHCDAEFFFAVGVRSRDVKRCAAKYTDHAPSSALRKGLEDAVAERSADGAFWSQRDVRLCVDYPAQSLAALGGK